MAYFLSDYDDYKDDLERIMLKDIKIFGRKEHIKRGINLKIYDLMTRAIRKYRSEVKKKRDTIIKPLSEYLNKRSDDRLAEQLDIATSIFHQAIDTYKNNPENYLEIIKPRLEGMLIRLNSLIIPDPTNEKDIEAISLVMKNDIEEIIDEFGTKPAYLFVLGVNTSSSKYKEHLNNGNFTGNIVGKKITDVDIAEKIVELGNKDNAIILNANGKIISYDTLVEKICVTKVVKERLEYMDQDCKKKYEDRLISEILGFSELVSSRHDTAIGVSHEFRNYSHVTVMTLSEETGTIRRYRNGMIAGSPIESEMAIYYAHLETLKKR